MERWQGERMCCRCASMVRRYGEACTKTTAAKIMSASTQTINARSQTEGFSLHARGGGVAFVFRQIILKTGERKTEKLVLKKSAERDRCERFGNRMATKFWNGIGHIEQGESVWKELKAVF